MKKRNTNRMLTAALAVSVYAVAPAASVHAQQDSVLTPGDAVVTGFSGAVPLTPAATTLGIDLKGASARVLSLSAMPGAPSGMMSTASAKRQITAAEVGQVFAVALDDAGDGEAPNIFLGATSLFGLHIVEGNGNERLENGEAGAVFMDGQFGPEGSAGSIWRIDGTTGEISEFASLPANSGPGVGDVVFDSKSRQFFASDVDTGLIYRISGDGTVIDTFDHGVQGRTGAGLEEVADDGKVLDITDPAFDTNDPGTWGYTQPERRVWGLAINNGRLYYATAGTPQVWSIGLNEDGSFAADPAMEFDVEGLAGDGPVTDMLFDKSGRIYLAQRGPQKASFNFAEFAEPDQATVLRFKPATSGEKSWEPDPDSYAIGMPPDHNAADGGVALGLRYDENGLAQAGTCGETLWSTGGRLVSSDSENDAPADVHGLQGNAVSLVRSENQPPQESYFIDYDGLVGDAGKSGQMGDVEIFQPCSQTTGILIPEDTRYPPGFVPPGDAEPPEWPPEFPPPVDLYNTNLQLTKRATPKDCLPYFAGWSCQFTVRVRNTGPDRYFGDILVKDAVPASATGGFFSVGPVPPWTCWSTGPVQIRCWRPNVLLDPGQSVLLKVNFWVPNSYDRCRLRNIAEIEWAPGGTQWNTDPTDDRDGASARVPLRKCLPVHRPFGSVITHRPVGSDVHRPKGSRVHRPKGSVITHRPVGSDVHRPKGSRVHRPRGSVIVHRPRGSGVHRPRGSVIVHRPRGSRVHRPRGSVIVHRPRGSRVHRPRGSVIVHRPRGSRVHRPKGSRVHRPHGSVIVHRPRGSRVHRPKGSRVHRPRGSVIVHRPRGSRVHRPKGSRVHRPRGSNLNLK